jgi:DNA primase
MPAKAKSRFSVNVNSGAFHCFGCDTSGGDVIDFVRLRDGLTFKEACQRLGAWQDVSDADRRAIAQQSAEREKKQAEEARLKSLAHEERIKLRDEIHTSLRETEAQYMSSMEMEKL